MDLDALRKQKQQRKQAEAVFRNRETLTKSSLFNKQDSTNEANRHFELGNCYFDGLKGYPEDERKAVYEYLKAAELGHTSAMKEVAYDYMDSSESALGYDLQKARAWGLKTVECHDMDGYLVLSEVEKELGNGYEAFKLLEKGADNKSRDCIEQLAYLYYWGSDIAGFNVGKDGERALKLLTSVQWDNDYCLAYELLGHIYWDQEKHFLAKEYYERALKADPELYGAMASLGTMLRSVDEVKDYRRAKELLLTASEAGNLTAMNEYGVMLYLGEDMEQDLLGAIEWFEKSAEGGNTQAMLNLGDVLLDEDPELARYWFNQAKEHGDNRAV